MFTFFTLRKINVNAISSIALCQVGILLLKKCNHVSGVFNWYIIHYWFYDHIDSYKCRMKQKTPVLCRRKTLPKMGWIPFLWYGEHKRTSSSLKHHSRRRWGNKISIWLFSKFFPCHRCFNRNLIASKDACNT